MIFKHVVLLSDNFMNVYLQIRISSDEPEMTKPKCYVMSMIRQFITTQLGIYIHTYIHTYTHTYTDIYYIYIYIQRVVYLEGECSMPKQSNLNTRTREDYSLIYFASLSRRPLVDDLQIIINFLLQKPSILSKNILSQKFKNS